MTKKYSGTYLLVIAMTILFPLDRCLSQDDYEKWKKQEEQKLQQWKDERDQSFSEFLKKEWKQYEGLADPAKLIEPKPIKLPTAVPRPEPAPAQPAEPRVTVHAAPPPAPLETEKAAPLPPPRKNADVIEFNFFGEKLGINYDKAMQSTQGGTLDENYIGNFWETQSKSDYQEMLVQATGLRQRMKLNDWGYAILLHSVAAKLFPGSKPDQTLFLWFMLAKSGYRARVGYSGNKVSLLLPTANRIFGLPYYTLGKEQARFYAMALEPNEQPEPEPIRSYDQDYPDAVKVIDCSMPTPPEINGLSGEKNLAFTFNGEAHSVAVKFNTSDVKFLEWYPQTDMSLYFNSTPSNEAALSLLTQLKPLVDGKTETEAVNLLLRFVQTAFVYKTDQEQFGREKPMYPDETLYYSASDCEDRAVLFAYIVRSLLGLRVIGLKYPNHVATAVKLSSTAEGDQVVFDGAEYAICDPTYENADIGMCMPEFKNVRPGVVPIK